MKIPDDFPQDLIFKLKKLYSSDDFHNIQKAFSQTRITSFRVNRLKSNNQEVEDALKKVSIVFNKVTWYEDAYFVEISARKLGELPIYHEGKIYIQSLSSMVPVLILDPKPEERVLDLTAAPGSKTTQMAVMMNNSGEIIANDTSSIRLKKLQVNLANQGIVNTKITKFAGQSIWMNYPEYFDKVLVDVPCSMEGRISFQVPKSYRYWSQKKVKEMSHLQKWLLRSGFSSLKVGGSLVYSTCTLSPEENEEVVDWLLKKEKACVNLVEITGKNHDYPFYNNNNINFSKRLNSNQIYKTRRIFPSEKYEGFFIALITKLSSNCRI